MVHLEITDNLKRFKVMSRSLKTNVMLNKLFKFSEQNVN